MRYPSCPCLESDREYQRIAEYPEQCDTHHVHASKVIGGYQRIAEYPEQCDTHHVHTSKVIGGYQRIAEYPEQCDTHHVHASKVIESIKGSRSIRSNAIPIMSMRLGYRAFQRALHRAVRGPPANRRGSRHRYASAFRCSDTIPGMRVHRC